MIVYSVSMLSRTGCINIGYATETGVTQIGFDCSTWLERWPDMTVEVWVTAPGAASAYEAKTHRKGDVIVWEVMQSDTQTPGAGRVEVIGYTADKRKLSATVSTRIEDSMLMAEGTEPPEAQQPWYTAAQEAKARAEALARHAPIIEDGMWMLWDPDKGAYVNSGVQAQAGSGLPEGAGPWMQVVTGADGVARWEPRIDKPGDPHQYLTTDGNGKPRWEDKLAYEESAVVEIMPTTDVGTIWYSQKTIACPYEGKVKIGDTGSFILDGVPHDYVAIEDIGSPPAEMTLDVDGVSDYVKLNSGKNMILYNIGIHPSQSHTIALTVNSKNAKTFDADLMGKNAGANKVLVTDENGEAVWSDSLAGGAGGGITVILRETTLEYKGTGTDGYASHELHTPLAARLSAGMVCEVVYNGKAYILTAKTVAEGELLAVGLGNLDAAIGGGTGTGEPFCIIQTPDALAESLGYLLVTDLDGTESVTLSITAKTAGGDSGGGILYVTARLDDSTEQPAITHASHTYEEIDAAVTAGKFCVLKLDAAGGTGAMVFFVPLLSKENIDGEAYKFTLAMNGSQIIIGVTRAGWMMMIA